MCVLERVLGTGRTCEFRIVCQKNDENKGTKSFNWKTKNFEESPKKLPPQSMSKRMKLVVDCSVSFFLDKNINLDEVSTLKTQMDNYTCSFPSPGDKSNLG